jgi:hypothetical protein
MRLSSADENKKLLSILVIVVPLAAYVLHFILFRGWIVDDAGISFAYARNLADGNGLVAQPGSAPVEGYSNFAWVVLLAPLFLTKKYSRCMMSGQSAPA